MWFISTGTHVLAYLVTFGGKLYLIIIMSPSLGVCCQSGKFNTFQFLQRLKGKATVLVIFLAELQNSALNLMCGGQAGGRQQLVSGLQVRYLLRYNNETSYTYSP